MDGFIGLSSRRRNLFNSNLGIQKIGTRPFNGYAVFSSPEVVGYYESGVSVSTVYGTGVTSPPMYLKAGDVVYIMGCEGNIGSTTTSTAATTFTGQGPFGATWNPLITNIATTSTTSATHREVAMLNARQNQWSPSSFVAADWPSVSTGAVSALGTYRSFLSLRIILVTQTGTYTVNTATGPRGTGNSARHVYCIAFRGVDTSKLSSVYFEPVVGDTQFVKATRSRISTGVFQVGADALGNFDCFYDFNIYGHQLIRTSSVGNDLKIHIGMIPELDLAHDMSNKPKNSFDYHSSWIGSLWSDQWDGSAGFSSMCGLDTTTSGGPLYPSLDQTFNHSGNFVLTPGSVISTCYEIVVPSL